MKGRAVTAIMLTLLFIGLLALAFRVHPIEASVSPYSPADAISIVPSTATILVNQTVTVEIIITNITGCACYCFQIDYQTTILECVSSTVDTDPAHPMSPTQMAPAPSDRIDTGSSTPGHLMITTVWKAATPTYTYEGDSVAAEVTFKGKTPGISSLTFTHQHACDYLGNDIFFSEINNGSIVVSGPRTLTINSLPTGVLFTADGTPHWTSWSKTYEDVTSVSVVMPAVHTVGNARYVWSQWNDGNPSRSRTVTLTSNVTLTAYYDGPYYYYEFTVISSPFTGIPFTINGTPQTTPYTGWLLEGSYRVEVPTLYGRHIWQYWLEDGDTNRTKTVNLNTTTTLTAVYELPVVGGIYVPTNKLSPLAPYVGLTILLAVAAATVVYAKKRKRVLND